MEKPLAFNGPRNSNVSTNTGTFSAAKTMATTKAMYNTDNHFFNANDITSKMTDFLSEIKEAIPAEIPGDRYKHEGMTNETRIKMQLPWKH